MNLIRTIARKAVIAGMLLPALSYAAPELILTWKAASYVPADYAGKALPVAGTPIDASLILVDGGKAASLTAYDVNWYAGEERIAGGTGKTAVRVTAPATGQDTLELRASVGKYNGQTLDAFVTVPVVRPEILIRRKAGVTGAQEFTGVPYFWNVTGESGLVITWEDGDGSVTVRAVNRKNALEFAQTTVSKL